MEIEQVCIQNKHMKVTRMRTESGLWYKYHSDDDIYNDS